MNLRGFNLESDARIRQGYVIDPHRTELNQLPHKQVHRFQIAPRRYLECSVLSVSIEVTRFFLP